MSFTRLRLDMLSLECSEKDVEKTFKLISSFQQVYPWMEFEEFLMTALETTSYAKQTYRSDRKASFTTWLITLVRNEFCTLVRREATYKRVFGCLYDSTTDFRASKSSESGELVVNGLLSDFAEVLSPYAWSLLCITLEFTPRRPSIEYLSQRMRLSPTSVCHLRGEVKTIGMLVMEQKR